MSNFARFYALLKQLPHADKETLVSAYSNGKTSSLREFSKNDPKGFNHMLTEMQNMVDSAGKEPKVRADEPQKRRFRSLILKALQEQGVTVKGCDWSAVNVFVEKYAGNGKSLKNMSLDELKTLNRQVHKLLDWYNAKQEIALRLAIMN